MLESEYAFAGRGTDLGSRRVSGIPAEDSLVLSPGPEGGTRHLSGCQRRDKNKLEWYPAIGDVAPGGDLGFTTGPWVFTLAGQRDCSSTGTS